MSKSQPADRNDRGGREGWRQLTRYTGLAAELAIAVGVAVWIGVKADEHLKLSFPVFSWVVPLLVIVVMLVQLIRANSGKKK